MSNSSPMTTFESQRESLHEMLRDIGGGKYQLPDFQRGWVWDDAHIVSLLASVRQSYPIGAVMTLETGNADVRFKPRPVEGVHLSAQRQPERLILDGQQRLTSLYQSLLMQEAVATRDPRGKPMKRWYYIDINKALDPAVDAEEAILSVSEDRRVKNFRNEVRADYSSTERECRAEVLPLNIVFDMSRLTAWQMEYFKDLSFDDMQLRVNKWNHIFQEIVQRFQQYQVPVIALKKETPKEAVCQVFEKVNTGGVSLTVFELVTATYAADDYSLRDDWAGRRQRLSQRHVLHDVPAEDFLASTTLLSTWQRQQAGEQVAVSGKRKDMLRLPLDEYTRVAPLIVEGYDKAAQFLFNQTIYAARDVPYRTQLIPLAAIFADFADKTLSDPARQKISQWYWCGVFGELYGSATETRFARDLPEVLAWIAGGPEPITVTDCNFSDQRLFSLRRRNSAAYKGLHALLMQHGALDLCTGERYDVQVYFDKAVDIHHIFPRKYCETLGIEKARWDCIVNKTPLSSETNRFIGGVAPSAYLKRIEDKYNMVPARLDKILQSHLILPAALRADQFDTFFTGRMEKLLGLLERATGTTIQRSAAGEPIAEMSAEEDEDLDDSATEALTA